MTTTAEQHETSNSITNRRGKAVEALIESLGARFPEKGFLLHPSLRFSSSEGDKLEDMFVAAGENIQEGQTLLVVPEKDRLQSKKSVIPKDLKPLYEKVAKKLRSLKGIIVEPFHVWLVIRVMNVLSAKNKPAAAMDPLCLQASTWPSEEELKSSYFGYWDGKRIEELWGYKSGLTLDYVNRTILLNEVFDKIVHPLLRKEAGGGKDFVDESLKSNSKLLDGAGDFQKQLLRNTFLYADGIVWTRSHSISENDCQIIPLVDLFNGDVYGTMVGSNTNVNVRLVRGKWPFLGGGVFKNDCNLPCSCVYALRDIEAGEELIIGYAEDMTVNHFVMKYGFVPKSFLEPSRIRCDVSLWCDPDLIPRNPLRIACLRTNGGFPLEDLETNRDCSLATINAHGDHFLTSLEMYTRGVYEDDEIKTMRQFLILAILADEEELNRNLKTGRLRGLLYESRVLPLLCKIIDYNLGLLQGPDNTTTSADDVRNAGAIIQAFSSSSSSSPLWEASALLARVVYRETLLAWRHAFVQKAIAGSPRELNMDLFELNKSFFYENAHPCLLVGEGRGCGVCGKTYPALRCARCRAVQYCCREHQKSDWKDHKGRCGIR